MEDDYQLLLFLKKQLERLKRGVPDVEKKVGAALAKYFRTRLKTDAKGILREW